MGGVELTESQYRRIADCLPRQRGNVSMTNLQLLNALLYMVEHASSFSALDRQNQGANLATIKSRNCNCYNPPAKRD